MKTIYLLILTLAASFAARADFSYTQSTKATQGPASTSKIYFRGSKMVTETGTSASIIDFATQTITIVNKGAKTYSVKKFSEIMPVSAGNVDPKMDFKETGASQTINGLRCSETVMSMSMDAPPPAKTGTRFRVEVDLWMSTAVPGWQNLRTFYQANASSLIAIAAGSSGLPKIMAELQKKMITMDGVQVRQSTRLIPVAKDALAPQGPPPFESIIENTGFSAGAISDSIFAVPTGFTKK